MELSDFEIEVMQLFWQKGESSAPQIHKLVEQSRPVAYSTVKTIIDRLEKKGALTRSNQLGRTIYYSYLIQKNQFRKPLIKDFISRVFLGKSKPLVAHIIEEEPLSLEDIQYLESVLKARKKELE